MAGRGRKCPAHARQYERRRGTATQRGYGAPWRRQRAEHLAAHPYCADPLGYHARRGERVAATLVDHIVPKRQGGSDEPSNCQSLCARCHGVKIVKEGGGWG